MLIALLAEKPQYNIVVTHIGLLAPFAYMGKVGFPINAVIKAFDVYHGPDFQFVPHTHSQNLLAQLVCRVVEGLIM